MTGSGYALRVTARVRLAEARDERAPGGAITLALCGSWDHDGACRWPHHTDVIERDDYGIVVRTYFDAPGHDLDEVRARIEAALNFGELEGPDGRVTRWTVMGGVDVEPTDRSP